MSRTTIVDSVTHELRPLTSIKASVRALLTNSRLQPSQRKDLLIVINEEADRLNQLVYACATRVAVAHPYISAPSHILRGGRPWLQKQRVSPYRTRETHACACPSR